MFFNKSQKKAVVSIYGKDAENLFTMFLTYQRIIALTNENRKNYAVREFRINIKNKFGKELSDLFFTEFVPTYQGTSLAKELSKEGQKYVDVELAIHQHTHPTSFPLIEEVKRQNPYPDADTFLSELYTYSRLNRTLGDANASYAIIDNAQNQFLFSTMRRLGKDFYGNNHSLTEKYGTNELLYDELDERNNRGLHQWFRLEWIPYDVRHYF